MDSHLNELTANSEITIEHIETSLVDIMLFIMGDVAHFFVHM